MALTNAEKQARHREKVARELQGYRDQVQVLLDELANACERGRCPKLTDRLPLDPIEACGTLAERLRARRLIVCRREDEPPAVEVPPAE